MRKKAAINAKKLIEFLQSGTGIRLGSSFSNLNELLPSKAVARWMANPKNLQRFHSRITTMAHPQLRAGIKNYKQPIGLYKDSFIEDMLQEVLNRSDLDKITRRVNATDTASTSVNYYPISNGVRPSREAVINTSKQNWGDVEIGTLAHEGGHLIASKKNPIRHDTAEKLAKSNLDISDSTSNLLLNNITTSGERLANTYGKNLLLDTLKSWGADASYRAKIGRYYDLGSTYAIRSYDNAEKSLRRMAEVLKRTMSYHHPLNRYYADLISEFAARKGIRYEVARRYMSRLRHNLISHLDETVNRKDSGLSLSKSKAGGYK